MRQIKFRGYSEMFGWVHGCLVKGGLDGTFEIQVIEEKTIMSPKVHQASVGQFTGLYDKNGKDIYEGDILRTEHTTPLLVVYEDGGFCFYNDLTSGSDRLAQNRCERLEIYGNVHENKDLLNT